MGSALLAAALAASAPALAKNTPFGPGISEAEVPIALLIDASSGQVLFEQEADRRFVPASITKVMTLYTAFELIEDGRLDLRQPFNVSTDAWQHWRGQGSTMFLEAGDKVPLADLLSGIATVSANDAAIVVAEEAAGSVSAWTQMMNAHARRIGMAQSHFGTPNGWPDGGRTFTTAHDLARLARALIDDHPEHFARFIGRRELQYRGVRQVNHDPLIGRVAGADGIKTGYTNEAGYGFLGTARRGDQRLVLVVAGVYRPRVRAQAARNMIEWGFTAFDRRSLFASGAVVGTARVQAGDAREVGLVTDGPVTVNVPKGKRGDLQMTIVYDGPIRAPIALGDKVATLVITAPDMATARVPLRAQHSVAQAGFFDRIANAFAGWLG